METGGERTLRHSPLKMAADKLAENFMQNNGVPEVVYEDEEIGCEQPVLEEVDNVT